MLRIQFDQMFNYLNAFHQGNRRKQLKWSRGVAIAELLVNRPLDKLSPVIVEHADTKC